MRARRYARLAPVLALLGAVAATAQQAPSGKVTIESKTIAVGVGVSWGDGKLTYQGKEYPFSVDGLSVADLGVSKASAVGSTAIVVSSA